MIFDASHTMNQGLIRHLVSRRTERDLTVQPFALPDSHPDPYAGAGSHPDVVDRVWDGLGRALPVDGRALIYDSPALLHAGRGVVLALAYGTRYAVRFSGDRIEEAIEAGCRVENRWSGGGSTNIEKELGRGWLFGCYEKREERWLLEMYEELDVSR